MPVGPDRLGAGTELILLAENSFFFVKEIHGTIPHLAQNLQKQPRDLAGGKGH